MASRKLIVYENFNGTMRSELRAERADPKPKVGERVAFTDDVEITNDPEDTLDEVFDALGLNDHATPQRRRIYEAARAALGVDADDDDTDWGEDGGGAWDAGMPDTVQEAHDAEPLTINVSRKNNVRFLLGGR